MLTRNLLESMKSGLFATVDLETVMAQANEQNQGQLVIMTINAVLERLKDHASDHNDEDVKDLCRCFARFRHEMEKPMSDQDDFTIRFTAESLLKAQIATGVYMRSQDELRQVYTAFGGTDVQWDRFISGDD